MKRSLQMSILLFLVLILILVIFLTIRPRITGNSTFDLTHSFTKAICDEDNFCEDYEIECQGNILTKITPTGFTLQQSKDWEDIRTPEEIERFCD